MEICSFVKQTIKSYTNHPLYFTWRMMNYRCFSDVHTSFATYGGAGITVCERWRWDNPEGFKNFIDDMGDRPEGHTVDRKDPYGSYEPSNCRWADKKTQQNNFRKESKTESGVVGVVKALNGKWAAQISFDGLSVHINYFDTVKEAKVARDEALSWKQQFGDEEAKRLIHENAVTLDNGKRAYNGKTSKYYGVSWSNERQKWRCTVWRRDKNGKLKSNYLGSYIDEEEAHKAVLKFLEKEKENKVEPQMGG